MRACCKRVLLNSVLVVGKHLITNRQKICQRRRSCRLRKLGARPRSRVDVHSVYTQFGPELFRRAYRMDYQSFKKLARLLHAGICEALGQTRLRRPNYRHVPNGPISTSVRLACSLRFFAGGSPYDIMSTYQIGHTDFFKSVWSVVKAINEFAGFRLSYPTSHEKQHEIAAGFQKVSAARLNCCAGAIDGILIWITKPSEEQCEKVGCSEAKFFCARKHKFGMNCQAICDVRGRFLDVSILYPGSTSDCLAFEGMALFTKLENCLLAPGLCSFGDNAYINCHFMATPFSGTAGGSKDAYNFYHSQLRFRIECAFGILTSRWAILRKALPANITIKEELHWWWHWQDSTIFALMRPMQKQMWIAWTPHHVLYRHYRHVMNWILNKKEQFQWIQHRNNFSTAGSTSTTSMCAMHNAQHGVSPERATHYCETSLAIAYTPLLLMPTSLPQVRNNSITTNHY